MKIWTLIGGICLGLLQTKTISSINEENYLYSNFNEENLNKLCCDPEDIRPAFVVGPPQHRIIVCYDLYDKFHQYLW
jgi:hypothetical protein